MIPRDWEELRREVSVRAAQHPEETVTRTVAGRYQGLTSGETLEQGLPELYCWPQIGVTVKLLGEAGIIAIFEDIFKEDAGLSKAVVGITRSIFARARAGERWDNRQAKEEWRQAKGKRPQEDIIAAVHWGISAAFPPEEGT